MSGTRSAWVAVVAGLISWAILSGVRLTKRGAIALALVAVAGVGLLFSPAGTRLRARLQWSVEEPAGGGRPVIWRDTLRMAAARPLTGYGLETFQTAFLQWQSEDLAHLFPDFHQESPHNTLLDALVSAGVPGLLLVLCWGGLGLVAGLRSRASGASAAGPLLAALVASGTAAMFNAVMFAPAMATALVLAALISLEPAEAGPNSANSGKWLSIAGIAVAAVVVLHAGLLAMSEHALASFRNHPGLPTLAPTEQFRMPGAGEDLYLSRALASTCSQLPPAGQIECSRKVLTTAVRATETADDAANAWYSLAFFSASANDAAGTERALQKAAAIAPNWFKPHWTLARCWRVRVGRTKRSGKRAAPPPSTMAGMPKSRSLCAPFSRPPFRHNNSTEIC